jgi:hypothetical protein
VATLRIAIAFTSLASASTPAVVTTRPRVIVAWKAR